MIVYRAKSYTREEWLGLEEAAHTTCFGEKRDASLNRHDFVVVSFVDNKLGGYFTCLEMDAETCYIQHGGVFPGFERTLHVLCGYGKMIGVLKEKYKRAWTRIENTNLPMLKLAFKLGFLVTGTHWFENKLYLELTNNFGG